MMKNILQNSISNVSVLILKLCITFIMAPIIVRALGNHDYGIWEIVISIVGYMGLLQFGLQPAIVRYVARYSTLKDRKGLNEIYSTALIFMGIVGAVSAMALMIWALVGADMLAENPGSASRYSVFLMVIATQVFVQFPGSLFMSVHHGFQRYNLTNLFTGINSIIFSAIMFMLLTRGYGLLSLALVNTIGIGSKYAIYGYLLRLGKYGGFIFRIRDVSMDAFKELFSFGAKSFVLGISSRISSSTDSIVIGSILGPVFVTFYMIPVNLVRHASSLISTITLNFMPFSCLASKSLKKGMKFRVMVLIRLLACRTRLTGII